MNQKMLLSPNGMPLSIVKMANKHDCIFDLIGTKPNILKVLRNDIMNNDTFRAGSSTEDTHRVPSCEIAATSFSVLST